MDYRRSSDITSNILPDARRNSMRGTSCELALYSEAFECTCCHQKKPANAFYSTSYTDQRTNQCKDCINIKRRVVRDKAKHGKFVSKKKCVAWEAVDYKLEDWRDSMLHFKGACAFVESRRAEARRIN